MEKYGVTRNGNEYSYKGHCFTVRTGIAGMHQINWAGGAQPELAETLRLAATKVLKKDHKILCKLLRVIGLEMCYVNAYDAAITMASILFTGWRDGQSRTKMQLVVDYYSQETTYYVWYESLGASPIMCTAEEFTEHVLILASKKNAGVDIGGINTTVAEPAKSVLESAKPAIVVATTIAEPIKSILESAKPTIVAVTAIAEPIEPAKPAANETSIQLGKIADRLNAILLECREIKGDKREILDTICRLTEILRVKTRVVYIRHQIAEYERTGDAAHLAGLI